jgi:hypothetical protein
MRHPSPNITYLEQRLKPGAFVSWQNRIYQVEQPAEAGPDPLTVWLRDVETTELRDFRIEEFLLAKGNEGQATPIFGPTLAKLKEALQEAKQPVPPVPETSLPESFLHRADQVIATVETVQRLVREQERLALLGGEEMQYAPAIEAACAQLTEPISRSTYYEYRKVYRQYEGDRVRIAASFRRKSFNQTRLSQVQLHFIDTLILRFYAGKRTLRPSPSLLYKLASSTLERTGHLWLDPDKCPGAGVENVIEELLDARLPMLAILANEEKASWLSPISLPSQSWFYGYLRWFEAQPDEGQQVIVSRYGQEMWERAYQVFDTFVSRAVRSLEYVFADHWLVDVFIVDEATRSRLDRLWLTLLVDAYSRSVLGMALLYEPPCIESIQSALRHAIWPKVSHQELGLKGEWVCYGIPQQLSLDNAWAHHSHSLEQLSRAISQGGQYNSIDLIFRPPYRGRYGALIERLFGNFSGQMKELLPGAIPSSRPQQVQNAARQACLLYQDIYTLIHQMIIRYQHTPHRELDGLTPHEKWLEGWQLGYGGWPPPLTDEMERLFWRREPQPRVITRKGISAFGLHYWSPLLDQATRKGFDGVSLPYYFSYEPNDISRLALFRDDRWLGDVYAKQLRRADGSTRSISLWERKMAQALARDRGRASQDWLALITELDELSQRRTQERKQAQRQSKRKAEPAPQAQVAFEQRTGVDQEPDYTDLLVNFVSEPTVGGE